ncbi:thioredoxin [Halorussus marinus]|uniref:thioredoxin n=1 Tax=Halorussus marinus TaxID=2505976 RepID=UPI00106EEDD3|nr:thioredoxin [Halorussus marinus]
MTDDELEAIRERKREQLAGERSDAGSETRTDATDGVGSTDEPVHVESVEQFSEITSGDGVVLVDFYADWCGPCKMLEPVVASVAETTPATVAKVDVDQHQGLASQYGVRSVPTLVVFADGEQVEQLVGMQDEQSLTRVVERHA